MPRRLRIGSPRVRGTRGGRRRAPLRCRRPDRASACHDATRSGGRRARGRRTSARASIPGSVRRDPRTCPGG
jgi:hypothetical protein